jgi:hypothetical protein
VWGSPHRHLEDSTLDVTSSWKLIHPYRAPSLSIRQSVAVVRAKRRVRALFYLSDMSRKRHLGPLGHALLSIEAAASAKLDSGLRRRPCAG